MADNYLQFSETLDALKPEEAAWLRRELEPIVWCFARHESL
jgi:hypothetical protein